MLTRDINLAIDSLNKNEVVAIPTETVYGLAGNAFSEIAIHKIFTIKKRPLYNPLIVHIKSIEYLEKVAVEIPETAYLLAKYFWPGPLTLVLKKHPEVSDLVSSGKPTVAVRVPNHPLTLNLLDSLEFPLAAPSANPFGSISPTSAEHVFNYFGTTLDVILDGGECERGIESTIIGFENNEPVLYRHGSISIEEIELKIGKIKIHTKNNSNPDAPGMLSKHYSPSTSTYLTNDVVEMTKSFPGKKIGLLMFQNKAIVDDKIIQEILSKSGDMFVAAQNLYAALHRLDNCNLDIIIAEIFPDEGLGKTINDRLKRASK